MKILIYSTWTFVKRLIWSHIRPSSASFTALVSVVTCYIGLVNICPTAPRGSRSIPRNLIFSEVRSGVPQGSVLDAILFSVFVNGIFYNMNASCGSLFADDEKIFAKVNTGEDGKKLQDKIKADLWATSEHMQFNGEKCAVMHCGKKNPRCEYTLGG